MDDDTQPIRSNPALDLDNLSVEDLKDRIEMLKAEILACEAAISRKGSAKSAADAMFNLDSSA